MIAKCNLPGVYLPALLATNALHGDARKVLVFDVSHGQPLYLCVRAQGRGT